MGPMLALFGLGAVSDLSPLTVPKQTLFSPGLAPQESSKSSGTWNGPLGVRTHREGPTTRVTRPR